MAQIPTDYHSPRPRVAVPVHLQKYSQPVTKLFDELLVKDEFMIEEAGEERAPFVCMVASPADGRFSIYLSVNSREEADDPKITQLAERAIAKVEETFPELKDQVDWKFTVD